MALGMHLYWLNLKVSETESADFSMQRTCLSRRKKIAGHSRKLFLYDDFRQLGCFMNTRPQKESADDTDMRLRI